jgi:hypothetical protein
MRIDGRSRHVCSKSYFTGASLFLQEGTREWYTSFYSSGDYPDFPTIAAFAATVAGEVTLITHHLSR